MSFIKGFKKVSSDDKATYFRHENGSELRVAHNALSPKMRKNLHELPQYLAKGGEVKGSGKKEEEKSFLEKAGSHIGSSVREGVEASASAFKKVLIDPISEFGSGLAQGINPEAQAAPPATTLAPQPAPQGPVPASVAPPQAVAAPAVDPNRALSGDIRSGLNKYENALTEQAKVQGELGQKQASLLEEQQKAMQDLQSNADQKFNYYMQQADAVAQDVIKGHINPNQFMENMGTGKKVATAIGLILSGIGSGLSKQENFAAKFLQQQIDRDVESQKANLNNKQNLVSHFVRQGESVQNAANLAKAFTANIYATKLEAEAARMKSPLAMEVAKQEAAKIRIQYAPLLQQAAQASAMSALSKNPNLPPTTAIMLKVPKELHGEAVKELAEYRNAQSSLQAIDRIIDGAGEVGVIDRLNPFTPDQIGQKKAALVLEAKKLIGEAMQKSDVENLVDPFVPGFFSNNQAARDKAKIDLKNMLISKMPGKTPILTDYGIVPNLGGGVKSFKPLGK